MNRIKLFFADASQEFKRINWPTFSETRKLTMIVIGLSIFLAFFLGAMDFVFGYLLNTII
ncbi:MAG: preprotein translocase subunit SecE [Candidatus Pacebacteria bacterium]|nr:preprotein translocase subunit SecE [Candidatus Paceibacterota bacterium]